MTRRTFNPIHGVLLVAGTFFMENLDGTVIVTALPQMARTFRVEAVDLNVGMTSYLLALAVFIPVSGWLADRFGALKIFATAIALFTLASLVCGVTNTLPQFIAARVLQGVGGAMMVPVGRLIVLRSTEKKDLIRAMAYITWPGLIAPVLGPPIGGFITSYTSWRWIFYLNLPLGIAAFLLALVLVKDHREQGVRSFDWWTFLCFGGACTAFMEAIEICGADRPHYPAAALSMLLSVVLGLLALRFTRRAVSPLIDLKSLRLPTYAVSMVGGSLSRIAISVAPFLLPLMFELTFHLSPLQAGSYLLALFAGNLAMKPFTTVVLRRFGFRSVLIVNGVFVAVAGALCCVLTPEMPKAILFAILFVNGICRSMQFTSVFTLAFVDVPRERLGAANSFFSSVAQLTLSMGVAVGALALRVSSYAHGRTNATSTLADFHMAFLIVAGIALLAAVDAFLLPEDAGAAMLHTPAGATPMAAAD